MNIYRWNNPGRKRKTEISYTDGDYCKYYDLDLEDFTRLVSRLHDGKRLTAEENNRYAVYIYTVVNIVLENDKFKGKSRDEQEGLADQAVYELCTGLPCFNAAKGSSIYSYAYRICYTAFCHYYTNREKDRKKQESIMEHCMEELREYLDAVTDGKVRNINHER